MSSTSCCGVAATNPRKNKLGRAMQQKIVMKINSGLPISNFCWCDARLKM